MRRTYLKIYLPAHNSCLAGYKARATRQRIYEYTSSWFTLFAQQIRTFVTKVNLEMGSRVLLKRQQQGATLVEVLVAMAISAILFPSLATALVTANAGQASTAQQLQATSLLREATEAVRVVREKGWTNIATNGTYYPTISANTWSLTAGTQSINGFTRQIVISDTQRNGSGAIVSSGGTVDPSTKHIVATVSWTTPYSTSVSSDTYMTRWQNNATWTQTTQSDFNGGTPTNTFTTNNAGGEVQMAYGSAPTWATPHLADAYDIAGSTTAANDIYVDGTTNRAYVVNGTGLTIINVANPAVPVMLGTYTVGSVVNGVYVSGNYAYLATAATTNQLTIVNVTTPTAPTLAGRVTLGGTAAANCVFVSGTRAYVGKAAQNGNGNNEFYVVNVTTPTTPAVMGSLNLSAAVNGVYIVGTTAYLATAITTAELTIVNVATPTAPVQSGTYNAAGTTAAATHIFAVNTTVYLTENNNTSGSEFMILNATTPAAVTLTGSYNLNANVTGSYIVGTKAYLSTAATSQQFVVLNIATPATPTLEGSYNIGSATNDIAVANGFAYLASTSGTAEMDIIASGYQSSGTFESSSFNAGTNVSFNYLNFTITEPATSNIQFQVATNSNNTTWNYVGPDGTAATYFTAAGGIPVGAASGQYIRYKAYFTSDTIVTPVLSDVTVAYSQ